MEKHVDFLRGYDTIQIWESEVFFGERNDESNSEALTFTEGIYDRRNDNDCAGSI